MQITCFSTDKSPELVDTLESLSKAGFTWLAFVREDSPDWTADVKRLTGVDVHDEHITDSMNAAHPSFFEGTDKYEMIIFRGLASSDVDNFESRPTAFFLFSNLIVTVSSRESVSVNAISERLVGRSVRAPKAAPELMLLVLSAMVDRFMAMREPLAQRLEEWQDALLDPANPFDDWLSLMRHRNRLRRLERMCDEQAEALDEWREETSTELNGPMTVRFNDLMEHIRRVLSHARHMEGQLESLVQIHFAAVAHRTNDIMRVLTILTAVFLPLTLVAGIFGMNFEHMYELKLPYAYYVTLGIMVLMGLSMLYLFRRKRWL